MNGRGSALIRWLYHRTVPGPVRSDIRLQIALLRHDSAFRVIEAPGAARILVLAPHMDDEVFGCGGTLALAVKKGARVSVTYLTDGRKGYEPSKIPVETPAETRRREAALVQTRKDEALRAGKILGFDEPTFLDLPDRGLQMAEDSIARLAGVLRRTNPTEVFLPFLTESHPDHWMTNCLFLEAAARAGLRDDVSCWGYEVWAPLVTNAVVDISRVIDEKRKAMAAFVSQIAEVDYPRVVLGLNAYRALFTGQGSGFAEAFYNAHLRVYRGIYGAVATGRNRALAAGLDAHGAGEGLPLGRPRTW